MAPETKHHFNRVVSLHGVRHEIGQVKGFNAKLAFLLTRLVGTMACAYVFMALALMSLPAAISSGNPVVLIAWVSQTFLQLVLLSVIMVGQGVQSQASDARAAQTYSDTEAILDRLDEHTTGGIKAILDRIDSLGK